jgi:hypothetical protein
VREDRRSFGEEIRPVVTGPVSGTNDEDEDEEEEEEEKKGEGLNATNVAARSRRQGARQPWHELR